MESYKRLRRSERIADRFLKARDAKGFKAAWQKVMQDSDVFERDPVKCRNDIVLKLAQAANCLNDGAGTECFAVLLQSFAVPARITSEWLKALQARLEIIEKYAPDATYVTNLLRSILVGVEESQLA